jgi:hypothetical protein
MDDHRVTHEHEGGRNASSQPVTPGTPRHEVERPARELDPDAERVDAVPVIDQPAGDALPPDVAGHDD